MIKRHWILSVAVVAASLLIDLVTASDAEAAVAPKYTAKRIVVPGAISVIATGINNSGQVTGLYYTAASGQRNLIHGFLYSNGKSIDIGSLGGGRKYLTVPRMINNAGQVTGDSEDASHNQWAFIYTSGTMINLGGVANSEFTRGDYINDTGQVVGFSYIPLDTEFVGPHATLWSGGSAIDLTPALAAPNISEAYAINNAGEVALVEDDIATFVDGQTLPLQPPSAALAINTAGNAVGEGIFSAGGVEEAFLYANETTTDLGPIIDQAIPGTVSSVAFSINNSGEIVGMALPEPETGCCADRSATPDTQASGFLYKNGKVFNLNSLLVGPTAKYVVLNTAEGINDSGQIVAGGTDSRTGGQADFAFVLTPTR